MPNFYKVSIAPVKSGTNDYDVHFTNGKIFPFTNNNYVYNGITYIRQHVVKPLAGATTYITRLNFTSEQTVEDYYISNTSSLSSNYVYKGILADSASGPNEVLTTYLATLIEAGNYKITGTSLSPSTIHDFYFPIKFYSDMLSTLCYGIIVQGYNICGISSEYTTSPTTIPSSSLLKTGDIIRFSESQYIPTEIFRALNLQQLFEYNYTVYSSSGIQLAQQTEVPAIKHIKFTVVGRAATLTVTGSNDTEYTLNWTVSEAPENTKFLGLSFVKNSRRASIPVGYDQDITIDGNLELYEVFGRDYAPTTTFSMNVYKNSAEPNKVDKTNQLALITTLSGVLRESSSIMNPQFNISMNEFPQFNYVYIPAFNRYYFVTDITSVNNNLWRLILKCDVLMSFKDGIKALNAFVLRNENTYDLDIIDKRLPLKEGYDVHNDEADTGLFTKAMTYGATRNFVVTGAVITIEEEE